jgi:hypothetical protein
LTWRIKISGLNIQAVISNDKSVLGKSSAFSGVP